jgi:hypothetical protein
MATAITLIVLYLRFWAVLRVPSGMQRGNDVTQSNRVCSLLYKPAGGVLAALGQEIIYILLEGCTRTFWYSLR